MVPAAYHSTQIFPEDKRKNLSVAEETIVAVVVLITQSYPTLWDPIDCSPPGSSVHGILQARVLEWVAILFSKW